MEFLNQLVETAQPYVVNPYAAAVVGIAIVGYAFSRVKAANARKAFFAEIKKQKKGVVHIYAIPRLMPGAPHISPNVTKIEGFLRANKIPYEFHFSMSAAAMSPTETAPFVAIDGELTGDSQFCVDAIKQRFGIPVDEGLDASQQAVFTMLRRTLDLSTSSHQSRTQMVDNFQTFGQFMVDKFGPVAAPGMPGFVVRYFMNQFRKSTINRLMTFGIGWLSDRDYQLEYVRDVRAMSALVAAAEKRGHKYLFGDKPTSVDCQLVGFLISATAAPSLPVNNEGFELMRKDTALQAYAKRFAAEFYPDLAQFDAQSFTTFKSAQ